MWVSVPLVRPVSEQRQCQISLWWYRERRGRVFRSPSLQLNGWYHHNRSHTPAPLLLPGSHNSSSSGGMGTAAVHPSHTAAPLRSLIHSLCGGAYM
jgi:hypothetical protein